MKTSFLFAVSMFAAVSSFGAAGCSKPKPPQLTPREVAVTSVDVSGFDMRVKLDAFNPNGFAISVRTIVAHVIVNGTQDLGTVTATQAFNLPANAHTALEVPMNVKWQGLQGFATLAQAKAPIPYTVDGTATVGGESLNIDVPFKLTGQITPAQIQQAATKSLKGIPGLQGLPSLLPH